LSTLTSGAACCRERRDWLPRAGIVDGACFVRPNALSEIFVGFVVSKIHALRVVSRSREQILLASTKGSINEFYS
jgi:hypothetical protein